MANFYGTLAGASIYHTDRDNAVWASSTEFSRTAALIRATDYLNALYAWKPSVQTEIDDGNTPLRIEQATYEAALREITAPGSLTPDYVATAQVVSESKGIGPLMKKREFAEPMGAASSRPRIALIDGYLRGLVASGIGKMNFSVSRV